MLICWLSSRTGKLKRKTIIRDNCLCPNTGIKAPFPFGTLWAGMKKTPPVLTAGQANRAGDRWSETSPGTRGAAGRARAGRAWSCGAAPPQALPGGRGGAVQAAPRDGSARTAAELGGPGPRTPVWAPVWAPASGPASAPGGPREGGGSGEPRSGRPEPRRGRGSAVRRGRPRAAAGAGGCCGEPLSGLLSTSVTFLVRLIDKCRSDGNSNALQNNWLKLHSWAVMYTTAWVIN